MATKRYLDVRYDVTDLSEAEVENLSLEAAAQAERSDEHPSVEVEIDTVETDEDEQLACDASLTPEAREAVERLLDLPAKANEEHLVRAIERANTLFQAYEAADDTSRANGAEGRDALLASELSLALCDRPSGSVSNVLFDEKGAAVVRGVYAEAARGTVSNGSIWFDPYVALYDPHDPEDEPLFLMYGAADGEGATLLVPGTTDYAELERRLVRFFGDNGWTIDDFDELAR